MSGETFPWLLVNGQFAVSNEPVARAGDRGLMYGDGCFETMLLKNSAIAGLEDHLSRCRDGLAYLKMKMPNILNKQEFLPPIRLLIEKNRISHQNVIIRLQVWRGQGRGYAVSGDEKIHWAIQFFPAPEKKGPTVLGFSTIKRVPASCVDPRFKLSNGINYILAANEAQAKNWQDGIMLTTEGFISETTMANIFWEKDGVWFTPSENCDLLPGITRKFVMKWLYEKSVKLVRDQFLPEEILAADSVFMCNSVRLLNPVASIESKVFITDKLVPDAFENWLNHHSEAL